MDLIDEFKDEFPAILRLSQSNQKRETTQKTSRIRMAIALAKVNRGTLLQGLNSISRSSKSVAKLLQPQLVCRLLELRDLSRRLLREVNAPTQPLYNRQRLDTSAKQIQDWCNLLYLLQKHAGYRHTAFLELNDHLRLMQAFSSLMINISKQVRKGSLFKIISFPAKTALASIIYASYAALIYLAVCVNAVLEKVKNIFQEEESIRQNREREHFRKVFSEPVLSKPVFSEGEIEAKPYRSLPEKPDKISDRPKLPANKQNKIQVLHSVFDQPTEMNA